MLDLISLIVEFVQDLGYLGIFLMTFVESTFIPIPAEITMIPAGYLVSKGVLSFSLVFLFSIAGTISGAWLNYYIAEHYGRKLILRFGKYFFMNEEKLKKIERYFKDHGAISTFTGRLIPGVKHYISFPAGLARMKLSLFLIYTALGGSLWMLTLILVGYFIGVNEDLVHKIVKEIEIGLLIFVAILIVGYVYYNTRRKKFGK